MTGTVAWQELIFVVGLIVAAGVGVAGCMAWLWSRYNGLLQQLNEIRVTMAEKYVVHTTLSQVEGRLERAIEKLGDRLEQAITGRRPHKSD